MIGPMFEGRRPWRAKFQPEKNRVRSDIALKTEQGSYVTALGAEADWLLAGQASRVLGWENFTLLRVADGRFALKTAHGRYVSACPENQHWLLKGGADRILGWELFELVQREGRFTLKSGHGRYLRVGSEAERFILRADASDLATASWLTGREL